MTLKIMCTYVHYVILGSRCKMASSHRVTTLDKIPVQISKDEALTPLSVVGPLFISSLLFHLSRTLLGAWRFCLFHSVYSSFHNKLDLIREPAFYWMFYFIFPNLSLFVSSYVKKKKILFVLVQQTQFRGLPGLGFGDGLVTGSCHSLFFSLLACPFVSRVISFIYDV